MGAVLAEVWHTNKDILVWAIIPQLIDLMIHRRPGCEKLHLLFQE